MIVDGRLNGHELRLAANGLYELSHEFGVGEKNRISFARWRERFAPRKSHEAARRQWERLKEDFDALGAPVRRERDGKEVYLVLGDEARDYALRILGGLTKYEPGSGEEDTVKGSRFLEIDIDDITPPADWEPDPAELEAMKESLRTCPLGLIHPIVVIGEAPPFELGLGRKRFAASRALGETKILARVVKNWDPIVALEENLVRSHYSPAEVVNVRQQRDRLIAERKAAGKSNRLIAEELGIDESTVRRCTGAAGAAPVHPDAKGRDAKSYPLSPTEQSVLDERRKKVHALMAEGVSLRQIAKKLDISLGTVQGDLKVAPAPPPAPTAPARKRAWNEIDPEQGEAPWLCLTAMEDGFYRALEEPKGADLRAYVVSLEKLFAGIARRVRAHDFDHKPPPPLKRETA